MKQDLLTAWKEAERLAAVAEREVMDKSVKARGPDELPSDSEVARAKDLRSAAIALMNEMLATAQDAADKITARSPDGDPTAGPVRH